MDRRNIIGFFASVVTVSILFLVFRSDGENNTAYSSGERNIGILMETPTSCGSDLISAAITSIKFLLFKSANEENSDQPTVFNISTIENVLPHFDADRGVIIIINGFQSHFDSYPTKDIRVALQNLKPDIRMNIIVTDWTMVNAYYTCHPTFYCMVLQKVEDVGKLLGATIKELKDKLQLSYDNFTLVGMSLGAHIAGYAGTYVNGQRQAPLHAIYGLDAAGPGFAKNGVGIGLTKESASLVIGYYTDMGGWGTACKVGHINILINGGKRNQPGCSIWDIEAANFFSNLSNVITGTCSHSMAGQVFAETVLFFVPTTPGEELPTLPACEMSSLNGTVLTCDRRITLGLFTEEPTESEEALVLSVNYTVRSGRGSAEFLLMDIHSITLYGKSSLFQCLLGTEVPCQ